MHSTLSERVAALAQALASQTALIEPGQHVSYGELDRQSKQIAAFLHEQGIGAGDRVALWLPNTLEWVTSFLACSQLGAIALLVNTRFRSHEIEDLIERGKATALIYWPGFKGIDFDGILSEVPVHIRSQLKQVITRDELVTAAQAVQPVPPPHGDHGTLTFTTSGTTSLPKFVLHTESVILRHADAVAKAFEYDHNSRILASAPFCGAFGFATLIGGLLTGHTVVCEPVSTAASLIALIREHRVTHTFANNALILEMLQACNDGSDLASCHWFGFASFAPSSGELFQLAEQFNLQLVGLYGSSELHALTAAQPRKPGAGDIAYAHEPGGCLVHPQAKVRARDPATGHLVKPGESGEIEILTPSHMAAYLDNPQATHEAFTDDGYFKTGDLGWCVSEHQFVFQARMGDSLRLGGFLVNPAEIEKVVEMLEGVAACQVVSANQGSKAVAVAFVLLEPKSDATPERWRMSCKQRLAGFKVPAHFEVLDEFPMVQSANSAKVQKNKLRELAQQLLDRGADD